MKYLALSLILVMAGLYFGPEAAKTLVGSQEELLTVRTPDMCWQFCNTFHGPNNTIRLACAHPRTSDMCNLPFRSCCTWQNVPCNGTFIHPTQLIDMDRCDDFEHPHNNTLDHE
ncbi:unnamed protein product [Moneuplotes crassus]|uniref:Uncharacterized protein n=1 Tax=Euplotes crassus TaxID=5936 RepID=A0AAD1UPW1_EUPCR|nr:unnamed protein product [Moneuplotes crassus]